MVFLFDWWPRRLNDDFVLIQPAPAAPPTSVSTVDIPVAQPGGYFLPSSIPVLTFPKQPYYPNPIIPVDRRGRIVWPIIYPLQQLWENSAAAQMMTVFFPGGVLL